MEALRSVAVVALVLVTLSLGAELPGAELPGVWAIRITTTDRMGKRTVKDATLARPLYTLAECRKEADWRVLLTAGRAREWTQGSISVVLGSGRKNFIDMAAGHFELECYEKGLSDS